MALFFAAALRLGARRVDLVAKIRGSSADDQKSAHERP